MDKIVVDQVIFRVFAVVLVGLFLFSGCAGRVSYEMPQRTIDAVSKATTWNQHEGSEDALSDGKIPATDRDATSFILKEKGILGIVLTAPTAVKELRVFLGEGEPGLILKGFLGGELDVEMGARDPEGEMVIMVESEEAPENRWLSFDIQRKRVDNFELHNWGTAVYYEIQVIPVE